MKRLDLPARRRLCASALSLLLFALVAGILCLPRAQEPTVLSVSDAPLIDQFRLDRDQLRAQECGQLREILDDPATDASTRARAQGRLMDLMQWAEAEAAVEEILEKRGFECVLVSVHQDSANVLVRSPALTQADAALILELTARQTGLTGGAIKVIPVEE